MLNYIKFNYFYQLGGKKKLWETLEHNGVLFPPEYIKVDIPLIYDNKEINAVLDVLKNKSLTLIDGDCLLCLVAVHLQPTWI